MIRQKFTYIFLFFLITLHTSNLKSQEILELRTPIWSFIEFTRDRKLLPGQEINVEFSSEVDAKRIRKCSNQL